MNQSTTRAAWRRRLTIAEALHKVKCVPDRYRLFTEDERAIAKTYGISQELLENLLEHGMPYVRQSATRLFDAFDLENIGIDLQLASPRWSAMRWWSRSLAKSGSGATVRQIGIYAECPDPEHPGPCSFTLDQAFRSHPHISETIENQTEFAMTLTLSRDDDDLEDDIRPLVERARQLTFHLLRDDLAYDLGFLQETGLADCRLAARELERVGALTGLPTRMMSGLFVSSPFPHRHSWVQVQRGDDWVSVDPFHLTNMARWEIVDPAVWPPHRSPAALLLGLHERWQPFIFDNDIPAFESFRVMGV